MGGLRNECSSPDKTPPLAVRRIERVGVMWEPEHRQSPRLGKTGKAPRRMLGRPALAGQDSPR